jgi:hypothetical protein
MSLAIDGSLAALENRELIASVIDELRSMVGLKLMAYMAGISERSVVDRWIDGTGLPTGVTQDRLRLAHKVSKVVFDRFGKSTVQGWLQGMNPDLNDQITAVMIRESVDPMVLESELISAAEQFAAK